jgi:hypothetical protein
LTELRDVLEPLLKEIESLNEGIKEYDERMEKIAKEVYPEPGSVLAQPNEGCRNADTFWGLLEQTVICADGD